MLLLVAVLAVLAGALTAVATGLWGADSHPAPAPAARPSLGSGSAPSPAGRAGPAGPGRRRSASTAEAAAVRRLAAHGLALYCGGRGKRMVALTFDDGPGPYTSLAVAKLHAQHLRATFFLVGKQLPAYPGRVRPETALAAIGDHTITHPFLPALSQAAMVQEIAGGRTVISRAVGQPVLMFRPPYGGRTPAIDREVRALGLLQVLWNVDSADSLGASYAGIEANVIAGLHPGSIILMHENHGQTIRALPAIFAALTRRHLRAVTVPELVTADPPTRAQLRAGGRGCGKAPRTGSGG